MRISLHESCHLQYWFCCWIPGNYKAFHLDGFTCMVILPETPYRATTSNHREDQRTTTTWGLTAVCTRSHTASKAELATACSTLLQEVDDERALLALHRIACCFRGDMDSKIATCKTVTTCITFKILNRIALHFNFYPFHSPYYYIDVRNLSMIGQSICLIRVQCASYKEERMSCAMGRRKNKDGEEEGWRRRMVRSIQTRWQHQWHREHTDLFWWRFYRPRRHW
jgi:hypothetical protein